MALPSADRTVNVTISPEQRRQWREQGCFITAPLVDEAELEPVRAEFLRLWAELRDPAALRFEGEVASKLVSIGKDPSRLAFMAQLHQRSAVLARFCRHPALVELARQLLGGEVDQAWNQMILKAPRTGKAFAWHQDAQYAITEPLDSGMTVWIAVTRTTIENGTLRVIPGAHRHGLLPHAWDESEGEWRCSVDESAAVPALLEPGQVLVFGRLLPHASAMNRSNETRMAYQIAYQAPGMRMAQSGELFGDRVPVLRGGTRVGG